ncbi:hypothetical protein CIPAW_13G164600 [Carya illinoinensis]|uniref:Uncharacterized protein n=1 Tax=Carya illinoinensis TaxID=32201 RepID=A0A8T1NR75_CARIL|nr:hypothetical protein CIPAW_13G164600 [Carya illinoinensis]
MQRFQKRIWIPSVKPPLLSCYLKLWLVVATTSQKGL